MIRLSEHDESHAALEAAPILSFYLEFRFTSCRWGEGLTSHALRCGNGALDVGFSLGNI